MHIPVECRAVDLLIMRPVQQSTRREQAIKLHTLPGSRFIQLLRAISFSEQRFHYGVTTAFLNQI